MSDMIDRQAAIDAVHKNYDEILDFKSDGKTVAWSVEDILNSLPSAQHEKICVAKVTVDRGMIKEAVEKAKLDILAESKRKKGKWIIKDNPGTGWYRVTCSECGEDQTSCAPVIGFFPNAKVNWNYCPECGADMR